MPTSILSTNGELLIPREIRKRLGVDAGDRIDFVVEGDGRVTIRAARIDFRDLRGLLDEPRKQGVSIEEMRRAVYRQAGGARRPES